MQWFCWLVLDRSTRQFLSGGPAMSAIAYEKLHLSLFWKHPIITSSLRRSFVSSFGVSLFENSLFSFSPLSSRVGRTTIFLGESHMWGFVVRVFPACSSLCRVAWYVLLRTSNSWRYSKINFWLRTRSSSLYFIAGNGLARVILRLIFLAFFRRGRKLKIEAFTMLEQRWRIDGEVLQSKNLSATSRSLVIGRLIILSSHGDGNAAFS